MCLVMSADLSYGGDTLALLHLPRVHPNNHWFVMTVCWGWQPTQKQTGTSKCAALHHVCAHPLTSQSPKTQKLTTTAPKMHKPNPQPPTLREGTAASEALPVTPTTATGTHSYAPDKRNEDVLIGVRDGVAGRFSLEWRPGAKVSVLDSGFMLGDGVWEGLRLHHGVLAFARVRSGCQLAPIALVLFVTHLSDVLVPETEDWWTCHSARYPAPLG
jgi:hypothetical protein